MNYFIFTLLGFILFYPILTRTLFTLKIQLIKLENNFYYEKENKRLNMLVVHLKSV